MKKLLFLSLLLLHCSIFYVNAQTWQWQHGGTLKDVHFIDNQHGWAVGLGGAITHTTNGGQTWSVQYSGITNELKSVHFVDAQKGWIVGLGGTILYTENGGDTWVQQFPPVFADFEQIFFVNAQIAWIVGKGILLNTTDGGQSWVDRIASVPIGWAPVIQRVFFTDAQNGWIPASSGLLQTTNGGQSWVLKNCLGCDVSNFNLFFLNNQTGWIGGHLGGLARTANGGQSWTGLNSGTTDPIESIFFTNTQNGCAVTSGGALLRTTNSGLNWSVTTGYPKLYSVYFSDAQNGWAVGRTILHTTNGGQTWVDQGFMSGTGTYFVPNLNDVFFTDTQNGWAVGTRLLQTSSGGKDWIIQPSPGSETAFSCVYFLNQQLGWIVGTSSGIIYKTSNAGQSWVAQNTGANCISKVFFINPQVGWAVGPNRTIIKTINGGQNWSFQLVGSGGNCFLPQDFTLNDVFFTDVNNGWATGSYISQGIILHTSDGGQTWTSQQGTIDAVNSVAFTSAQKGWAVGSYGLWTTTNGGQFWVPQSGLNFNSFNSSIQFSDPQNGWFVSGSYGDINSPSEVAIFHTSNAGQNWTSEHINLKSVGTYFLFNLFFVDEKNGWVVGDDELIFKYADPPLVNTSSPSSDPDPIVLGKIYPQPAGPEFNLDVYSQSSGEKVKVDIYSTTGQILITRNEILSQGKNTLLLPCETLPSGIFYVTVQTRSFVRTLPLIKT